jgi:hypothetical protein
MEVSQSIVYAVILASAIVAVSVFLIWHRFRNWRRFASRHGLRFSTKSWFRQPMVTGQIKGRTFRLYKAPVSSDTGLLGVDMVAMSVGLLKPLPEEMEVGTRGPAGHPFEWPEEEAIELGDEDFDRRLAVRGRNASEIRLYMDEKRRGALLNLVGSLDAQQIGVRGGELFVIQRRMVSDVNYLEERLRLMLEVARQLEESALGGATT